MVFINLDGEVPKIVMSCETSDISQFCKLEWFEWVMSNDVLKLGHYLGPSINAGPVMTANTLTQNGQVLHRSI